APASALLERFSSGQASAPAASLFAHASTNPVLRRLRVRSSAWASQSAASLRFRSAHVFNAAAHSKEPSSPGLAAANWSAPAGSVFAHSSPITFITPSERYLD